MSESTIASPHLQTVTHAIDEVAGFLESEHRISFRLACQDGTMQTFRTATQRFFSTWTTSLMGSDLRKLEQLSTHPFLRQQIETIYIQDDCERNDPWNTHEPLRFSNVWPRDDTGKVISSEIGVEHLRIMLQQSQLRPKTIKVRDYRIPRENFALCPETTLIREYRLNTQTMVDPKPAAALAQELIHNSSLAIDSIKMQNVTIPDSGGSILSFPHLSQGGNLAEPRATDVIFKLSPQQQGQDIGFSALRRAELLVAPYWLGEVLYNAPLLEILRISISAPWDTLVCTNRSIAALRELDLTETTLRADTLSTLLAHSKESLCRLTLLRTTLLGGSTWSEALDNFGRSFPNLTSFCLKGLTDEQTGARKAIYFTGFMEDEMAARYQSGLIFKEKGSVNYRRLSGVIYDGPDAGIVLQRLLSYARKRDL